MRRILLARRQWVPGDGAQPTPGLAGGSPNLVGFDSGELATCLYPLGLCAATDLTAADDLRPDCGRVAGHLFDVDLTRYQRPGRRPLLSFEGDALAVHRLQKPAQR